MKGNGMGVSDNADYAALTQKLLGAIVAHGDDGIKREGMVGGFVVVSGQSAYSEVLQ